MSGKGTSGQYPEDLFQLSAVIMHTGMNVSHLLGKGLAICTCSHVTSLCPGLCVCMLHRAFFLCGV